MKKYNLVCWFSSFSTSLLLGVLITVALPFSAFAVPLLPPQGPVPYQDPVFGFFGDVGIATVTIYGPGVTSDLGETRFDSIDTSVIGSNDLTYFINLSFPNPAFFGNPTQLEVFTPAGPILPVITAAGFVGGVPVGGDATIYSSIDRIRFIFGSAPPSDIDLFIISQYLPNLNELVGTRLEYQGGAGLTDAHLVLPYDPPTAMPEPGTLLLLGSGLVVLAGLGRKKLTRKH